MSTETFVLPPRSKVGYLAKEIADEANFNPPPDKPAIPDWSQIKSLRHYFGRTGGPAFPHWLYHPTEEPRLVTEEEAAELGVCYREATPDERAKYGQPMVWDWKDGVLWRSKAYPGTMKFDPKKPDHGKTVVRDGAVSSGPSQATIDVIVATAVATALKSAEKTPSVPNTPLPAAVDPAAWEEFRAFQAWKKVQEAPLSSQDEMVLQTWHKAQVVPRSSQDEMPAEEVKAHHVNALAAALDNSDEDDRALLESEATLLGLKVDKRWSTATLRAEVSKKAAA